MIESRQRVVLALDAALTPGEEFAPGKLLEVMEADPSPSSTMGDPERSDAHFNALRQDLTARDGGLPQLTALIRWLIRELRSWDGGQDPKRSRLAAMFVISAHCDRDGDFWAFLAASTKPNAALMAALATRIGSLTAEPAVHMLSSTPISDKGIVDEFTAADRAADWATLASDWHRFGDLIHPDVFTSQAVRCLHSFVPGALCRAADRLQQTMAVMLVLLSLSSRDSLSVAMACTSARVELGALLRLTYRQWHRNEGQTHADLLKQLFLKIAFDTARWQQLMNAFNRYPTRHPHLQMPLGRALAQAPEAALQPYIDAIQLSTTGTAREAIANCLRAFRSDATPARCKALWKLAHDRWSEWAFGKNDKTEQLLGIGRSELDYAIVGFAVESMTPQQRAEKCEALLAELWALPDVWHASVTDYRRAVSRTLSFYQPYVLAQRLGANDDWLPEQGKQFLPFDRKIYRYEALVCMQ